MAHPARSGKLLHAEEGVHVKLNEGDALPMGRPAQADASIPRPQRLLKPSPIGTLLDDRRQLLQGGIDGFDIVDKDRGVREQRKQGHGFKFRPRRRRKRYGFDSRNGTLRRGVKEADTLRRVAKEFNANGLRHSRRPNVHNPPAHGKGLRVNHKVNPFIAQRHKLLR